MTVNYQEIARKNEEIKRSAKRGRSKNGRIGITILKATTLIKTKKGIAVINTQDLPLKLKITPSFSEQLKNRKQAKKDLKAYYDKDSIDPLFLEVIEPVIKSGENKFWSGVTLYWAGYARGIREHRQKAKETAHSAFDIISADDVTELSHELGISEDKLTHAVMEVISKRKNGGKA